MTCRIIWIKLTKRDCFLEYCFLVIVFAKVRQDIELEGMFSFQLYTLFCMWKQETSPCSKFHIFSNTKAIPSYCYVSRRWPNQVFEILQENIKTNKINLIKTKWTKHFWEHTQFTSAQMGPLVRFFFWLFLQTDRPTYGGVNRPSNKKIDADGLIANK